VLLLSYKTAAGTINAVNKEMLLTITCYTKADTWRLRMDHSLTTDDTTRANEGAKHILIYDATIYRHCDMYPTKCGPGASPRGRQAWAVKCKKTRAVHINIVSTYTSSEVYTSHVELMAFICPHL
jgi:hypothetical protein